LADGCIGTISLRRCAREGERRREGLMEERMKREEGKGRGGRKTKKRR